MARTLSDGRSRRVDHDRQAFVQAPSNVMSSTGRLFAYGRIPTTIRGRPQARQFSRAFAPILMWPGKHFRRSQTRTS
jgi:hypothetical protein